MLVPSKNTSTLNIVKPDIKTYGLTEIALADRDGRGCFTTSQAVAISSLSGTYINQLLGNNGLEGFKVEGKWFVYADSLNEFLSRERKTGPKGPRRDRQAC